MPPRTQVDYMNITFKEGTDQQQRYTILYLHKITLTRYTNDSCLRALGIFDIIYLMLDRIWWTHFINPCHPTNVRLTLEFLSSFSYVTHPVSHDSIGIVKFMLFNRDYEFQQDQIADQLWFQRQADIPCEVPQWGPWYTEFDHLWEWLTRDFAFDMEGEKSSHIHNPTICYFR